MIRFLYNKFVYGFKLLKFCIILLTVFIGIITLFGYLTQGEKINLSSETQLEKTIETEVRSRENSKDEYEKSMGQLQRLVYCNTTGIACNEEFQEFKEQNMVSKAASIFTLPFINPPSSGLAWTQQGLAKVGIVPSAYAAEGIGFASIKGFMDIWLAFRNIAYLILVLVIIAIGFLIMFRFQIDAQTVISLQNSLPRIVVALILITFSFAIAGFLIDIMYVLMSLGVSVLFEINENNWGSVTLPELQFRYQTAGLWDLWPNPKLGAIWNTAYSMLNILPDSFQFILQYIFGPLITIYLSATLKGVTIDNFTKIFTNLSANIGFVVEAGIGVGGLPWILSAIVWIFYIVFLFPIVINAIIALILLLTCLYFMFRLFFALLASYISIIIYIVFSPVILMAEAIPGRNAFGWWFRNLFAELLTFPLIVTMLLVGRVIIDYNSETSQFFQLPFLYGIDDKSMGFLVSLGIILMIPNFIQLMKGALGAQGFGNASPGLGMFFAGAGAAFGGGMGLFGQLQQWESTLMGSDPSAKRGGLAFSRDKDTGKVKSRIPGLGWLEKRINGP